jgi:hypothetical protein
MGDRIRASLPGALAGCYALYDHRGRVNPDSLYFAPPAVRLETTRRTVRHPGRFPTWSIVRLDSAGEPVAEREERLPYLFWGPTASPDSIHVLFATGFSGTDMDFAIPLTRTDTLHGHATGLWDAGPPFQTDEGAVTAVRIPCVAAAQPS